MGAIRRRRRGERLFGALPAQKPNGPGAVRAQGLFWYLPDFRNHRSRLFFGRRVDKSTARLQSLIVKVTVCPVCRPNEGSAHAPRPAAAPRHGGAEWDYPVGSCLRSSVRCTDACRNSIRMSAAPRRRPAGHEERIRVRLRLTWEVCASSSEGSTRDGAFCQNVIGLGLLPSRCQEPFGLCSFRLPLPGVGR